MAKKPKSGFLRVESYGSYFNIHKLAQEALTDETIHMWCSSMRDWASYDGNPNDPKDTSESLHFGEWLKIIGVSWPSFERLKKRSPLLQESYAWVIMVLGARRDKGAVTRRYSEQAVSRTIAYYDFVSKAEQDRLYEQSRQKNADVTQQLAAEVQKAIGDCVPDLKELESENVTFMRMKKQ